MFGKLLILAGGQVVAQANSPGGFACDFQHPSKRQTRTQLDLPPRRL
jgi:hypothetical protein